MFCAANVIWTRSDITLLGNWVPECDQNLVPVMYGAFLRSTQASNDLKKPSEDVLKACLVFAKKNLEVFLKHLWVGFVKSKEATQVYRRSQKGYVQVMSPGHYLRTYPIVWEHRCGSASLASDDCMSLCPPVLFLLLGLSYLEKIQCTYAEEHCTAP